MLFIAVAGEYQRFTKLFKKAAATRLVRLI
jgi:hypothetical protein